MSEWIFRTVTARFEPMAKAHPRRYKALVRTLALLGILGPLPALFVAVVLTVGFGFLVFRHVDLSGLLVTGLITGWVLLALLIVSILRSLWPRRSPPPDHPRLLPVDVPLLFQMLDGLQEEFPEPGARIHEVYITPDMNAGIVSRYRFGLPFLRRNRLIVGLPLLYALSLGEFRTVLAHELAHLAGHGMITPFWTATVLGQWEAANAVYRPNGNFDPFWRAVMRWYVPLFAALSYIHSRLNEHRADRVAARICGRDLTMTSLVALEVRGRMLGQHFMPGVWNRAIDDELPPGRIFVEMADFFRDPANGALAERILASCLKNVTAPDDTHPCLRERLQALREEADPQVAASGRKSAPPPDGSASLLLGEKADHFAALFSKNWKAGIITEWRERHQHMRERKKVLAELTEKARTEELSPEERWQRVRSEVDLETDPDRRQTLLRRFIEEQPAHAEAHFHLGCSLLFVEDESGLEVLERAMTLDADFVLASYEKMRDYLSMRGREDELRKHRDRVRRKCKDIEQARRMRLATAQWS